MDILAPHPNLGIAGVVSARPASRPRVSRWTVLLLVWPMAVLSGLYALERYAHTPGAPAVAPTFQPQGLHLSPRAGDQASIVMLAHPRCPCTRASLHELRRIMAQTEGRVRATVYFIDADGADANWNTGALWEMARAIPNTTAIADPKGRAAGLLGAHTSGQVVAFSKEGALIFSGGITSSRGHEGENAGGNALLAAINGEAGALLQATPVFGCALGDPSGDQAVR